MAEGLCETGFQIPENSDYVLFAEDLVNYVMLQKFFDYVGEGGLMPSRQFANIHFNENIKRAIDFLGKELDGINMTYFSHMYQNLQISSLHFTMLLQAMEQSFFGPGFNGRVFLMYCAGISNLAAYFYNSGILDAPKLAKSHIAGVLQNLMPADGWNVVNMATEKYK